jgi:hypothetical protein
VFVVAYTTIGLVRASKLLFIEKLYSPIMITTETIKNPTELYLVTIIILGRVHYNVNIYSCTTLEWQNSSAILEFIQKVSTFKNVVLA